MNAKLGQVLVFVGDAPACAEWYCKHLGFTKVASEWSATWCAVEVGGGVTLGFHQAYGADGPMKEPTGSEMSPHKLVFEVADVAAVRQQLVNAGAQVFEMSSGTPLRCDALDVEGHRFQLVQRA
jgi:catechol 2,3-dioxygenase-like lactoylglutathione lyase family enzyme